MRRAAPCACLSLCRSCPFPRLSSPLAPRALLLPSPPHASLISSPSRFLLRPFLPPAHSGGWLPCVPALVLILTQVILLRRIPRSSQPPSGAQTNNKQNKQTPKGKQTGRCRAAVCTDACMPCYTTYPAPFSFLPSSSSLPLLPLPLLLLLPFVGPPASLSLSLSLCRPFSLLSLGGERAFRIAFSFSFFPSSYQTRGRQTRPASSTQEIRLGARRSLSFFLGCGGTRGPP